MKRMILIVLLLAIQDAICETYTANPNNYLDLRDNLAPGDTLLLTPGNYADGLRLKNIHGAEDAWIVVKSAEPHRAVLLACDYANTMDIQNASYIKVEGLKFDGKDYKYIDAIKAGGGSGYSHHIWIDNNYIVGHGNGQQTVGISTKITCWDWIISRNIVEEAGTGLYLGDSDGSAPFIRGVIEFNLVTNPHGYCMQIKHQNGRPDLKGIPKEPSSTIIRHNVFVKDARPSPSGNRPNLLVGGQPFEGSGKDDIVEIYGNFIYNNPREYLFQGTGNISFHDNILVGSKSGGANFQIHNSRKPKEISVYNNSIYTEGKGVKLYSPNEEYEQTIIANAVFADVPVQGFDGNDNLLGEISEAGDYFISPAFELANIDLFPKTGCEKSSFDLSAFDSDVDWNKDFNGNAKSFEYYGAYSGEGENDGWRLDSSVKVINISSVVESSYSNNSVITVRPNPCSETLFIDFHSAVSGKADIFIMDLNGKTLRKFLDGGFNKMGREINLRGIPSGSYIVIVRTEKRTYVNKIMKFD